MHPNDQVPLSKTEEQLFHAGFTLASTCNSLETRIIEYLVTSLSRLASETPGLEFVFWTDGKITRFWKFDPQHTLRPISATLRPSTTFTTFPPSSGADNGKTVRSDPPEGEVGEIPSLAPPPNRSSDPSSSTGILAINPPPPEADP